MFSATASYPRVSAVSFLIRNGTTRIIDLTYLPFRHVYLSSHVPPVILVIMYISLLFLRMPIFYHYYANRPTLLWTDVLTKKVKISSVVSSTTLI